MPYRMFSSKNVLFAGIFMLLLFFIFSNDLNFINSYNKRVILPKQLINYKEMAVARDRPLGQPDLKTHTNDQRPSVIILTYMRSGSSLLGDILQQSPGAFYLYEPLHSLGRVYTHFKMSLTFVNGTERMWPFDFVEEAVNIIRFWLNCETTKVLRRGLRDGFMEKGIRSGGFRHCYNQLFPKMHTNLTQLYMTCALKVKENCEKASIRVMKTIRISMRMISHLLEEFPGLKIIHLIRDPRATLTSQSVFGLCSESRGGFYGCSNRYCTRVENDILETETLLKRYPDRIKRVFYEDIATKPIETSKDLYQFLGTSFTSHVQNYVFNITQAGNAENCAICTTRPNSTLHIDSWRKKIKDSNLQLIEARCNYILQQFNYTIYTNNTLLP